MSTSQVIRDSKRRWAAKKTAEGQEVGDIPPIADLKRRMRTRTSFRDWCETYELAAFPLAWSRDHLDAIARIEESVLYGALYAFAMPRGSGKTSLVRAGIRWATAHGHRRYPFLIGANLGKAVDSLESIKKFFRFREPFVSDFPEISVPAVALRGIANRSAGQTYRGESTGIEWSKDRIVLPRVDYPPNHPDYELGKACATAGSVIGACGLTGDGIRGSLFTTNDGEELRPDLVLLDDPQTNESASSPTQNAQRLSLIQQDVLGMAGPGKSLAAVMPCTVIRQGDMVDRMLDRKKNPLWRGHRTKLMRSMPSDMGAWERYWEVYYECASKEPPDFAAANEYYEAHRAKLDDGAEASWAERKQPHEVSAIQHAMHLYVTVGEEAFAAEYQNDPRPISLGDSGFLTADEIAAKVSGVGRGIVPPECTTLTAFIDVQGEVLYGAVVAWADGFGGQVVDYGTWPEQPVRHFSLRNLNRQLSHVYAGTDIYGAIYQGLIDYIDALCGRGWKTAGGETMRVAHLLIDAGWGDLTKTVYRVCRDSKHAAVISPSFGRGIKASNMPMSEWRKEPGEQRGHDWRRRMTKGEGVRHVLYDTNTWKTIIHRRFAVPMGEFGSLSLYKGTPTHHRQFSEHMTAEPHTTTTGRGREIIEFMPPAGGRDQHWFDCVVGAAVAGSIAGVKATGHEPGESKRRRRYKLSDLQRRAG